MACRWLLNTSWYFAKSKYNEWLATKDGGGNLHEQKKQLHIEEIECEMSSGNVFADIGIENPEEELTKAKLVWEIEQKIKKKKLTQIAAAKVMGINQPKVSALIRRKLDGFSVERLIHFLNALGEILILLCGQSLVAESKRSSTFITKMSWAILLCRWLQSAFNDEAQRADTFYSPGRKAWEIQDNDHEAQRADTFWERLKKVSALWAS
jgi:predicted XRE-type DNA-binding protein